MKTIRGLSLKKILLGEKNSIRFVTEAKYFFYAIAMLILGMELFLLQNKTSVIASRRPFVLSVAFFYLFYTILEYIFRIFIDKRITVIFSVLPGILLGVWFLHIDQIVLFSYAAFTSVLLRLLIGFLLQKEYFVLFGCFILDVVSVVLRFMRHILLGDYSTDKILFLCLIVLTLSSLQQFIGNKQRTAFPFQFFILMAVLLFLLPVKKTPIDWTNAKKLYDKAAETVNDTFYSVNGIFKSNTYSSGYSSFSVTGGKLKKSNTKQLIIRTGDYPYYVYKDNDTGKNKVVKKTAYLPGTSGADYEGLIDFLLLLHTQKIDKDTAALFSRVSGMDVEYAYLTTNDLILPSHTFFVTEASGKSLDENETPHKKGFCIKATYLDIDYGSPYITSLYNHPKKPDIPSYEDICSYAAELYNINLSSCLSKQDYESIISSKKDSRVFNDASDEEDGLNISGTTEEMQDLAKEITKDATTDYEKCVAIESYLRQFPYNTDTVGGYDKNSTLATTEGMADIANRFLFDTKEGYCVHYTASMVMLLRLNGIPARPVMGYRYDFPTAMKKEYFVTSDNAHAWPVAYIEGAGWIPFEPTGVYADAISRSWRKQTADSTSVEKASENHSLVSDDNIPEQEAENRPLPRVRLLKIGGLVVASIVLLLFLILLGRILARKIYYRFASDEKRLKMDVEDIKNKLLKQTAEEFHDRGLLYDYLDIAPEEQKMDIKQTFDLYYKAVYGK